MTKNSSRRKKRSRSRSRRTATTRNVRNALIVGVGGAITAFLVWGAGLVGDLAGGADPVLYVTAELAPPFAVCEGGTGWVFQREAKALSTAPLLSKLDRWAAEGGGVPASGNYVDVQLQGAGSRTVIVTDIRIEVTRRRRPPRGRPYRHSRWVRWHRAKLLQRGSRSPITDPGTSDCGRKRRRQACSPGSVAARDL